MGRPRADGIMGDDRIRRLEETNGRESVATQDADRGDDGTIMTLEERRRMIRNEFKQEALPQPPELRGFATCWLSTTNSQDPIPRRLRLGYTPVRFDELPGFDLSYKAQSGQWEGCVNCNEMVLFKIPLEVQAMMMDEFHHRMPLAEEERITALVTQGQETDSSGRPLGKSEGDGFNDLVQRKRSPFVASNQ